MAESIQGNSAFLTTRWTLVHDAAESGNEKAGEALGELCSIYWVPLYRYARRSGKSREDAEDLVQGFLAHLARPSALSGVSESRGRFRTYLLGAFNHWMINEWRSGARLKRGGGISHVSLHGRHAEMDLGLDLPDTDSPDRIFDREWAHALLAKVLEDLSVAESGDPHFGRLRGFLSQDSTGIRYAELAHELGMSEGAARVAVHRLRKKYRHLLVREIERTLTQPDLVEDELRSLLMALSGA
jgi:RNA polymerase sigma factor (sigma-70 family)